MNRATVLSVVVASAMLGGVAGWLRPLPQETSTAAAHDQAWWLPAPADLERSTAAQFAAISDVPWLGDATPTGQVAEWTLLGVVGRPDDRAILIRVGSEPLIKRLRSGDTLPDGSKLIAVGSDGVMIDRGGCRTKRPLYPSAQASAPADAIACEPASRD